MDRHSDWQILVADHIMACWTDWSSIGWKGPFANLGLHGEFWMTKPSKNPRPRCRTHSASRRFLAIQSCQNTLRVFPGKPLSPEEASQQGCLRTWNPKKSDALSKHRPILPIPCPAAGHEWFEISKRSRPSRCALASPGLVQLVDAHPKYVQMMMSYGWSKFKRPQEF